MDSKFAGYLIKRILLALGTILFVITVTFFLCILFPAAPF